MYVPAPVYLCPGLSLDLRPLLCLPESLLRLRQLTLRLPGGRRSSFSCFPLVHRRTLSCFTACSNIRRHFVRTKYKIFVAGDDQTVCDVFFALETMSKFRIHVRCLCVESSL